MDRKGTIAVPNETTSHTIRTTREGKTLRYDLKVLQQPQRARACGSGSKSSADRRPVDPPPIVQLKIHELKPNAPAEDVSEDITFLMNANYFLFATLEPARVMAQARGMPDPNKPTVLTGTPVAGMVYLDRPESAGYFIFPDLSVRHEGHFRLSFSLYEELKRTEDHDKVDDSGRDSSPPDTHVTHRLEVKSEVLQVYSAKKFPGLTESTSLSRVVAEQGCRVRIRRDVRMRKATMKPGAEPAKGWDDYEDQTAERRAKMSRTPEIPPYGYPMALPATEHDGRPRSPSNASHHSQSLRASLSRRQSNDMAHVYQQQHQQQHYGGTAPQTPSSGITPTTKYGPSPSQQYSQPPYMQQPQQAPQPPQQQPMQPPPVQYQPHGYPAAPIPQQSSHYGYQPAPSYQPQYAAAPPEANGQAHRPSGDWSGAPMPADYHQRPSISSSVHAPAVQTPQTAHMPYNPHPYQQAPQPYQAHQPPRPSYYPPIEAQSTRAPPPEPIQPPSHMTAPTPPLSAKPHSRLVLPPISQMPHPIEPASPATSMPTNGTSYFSNISQTSGAESHKRSYGSTFSTAHHDTAQKAGARPSESYGSTGGAMSGLYADYDVDNDEVEDEGVSLLGGYKRADGTAVTRRC